MKENKLRARWSKREKNILVSYPLGIQTQCDCYYLLGDIFNKEFMQEMKDRGYDITTLKFEITVDKNGDKYAEKFPSLSNETLEV